MRSLLKSFGFLACFLFASECFGEQVYWGMEYWQDDYKDSATHKVFIIKVDLQAKGIRPFVTPELNGSVINTSKFVSTYGVQAGINTAFFDMGGTNKAIGYFSSDGQPYVNHSPNDGYPTIGFSQDNHYLYGINARSQMYNATSGSNVLVENGKAVDNGSGDFSKTTHPRTAVGIDQTGRYFYMIVVDGRYSGSTGMSLATLSNYMIGLGIYHGINLDGGGSSTMVIAGKGLMNRPTGGTYQRPVASHLGFFANSDCTPSEEICNNIDDDCDKLVNEEGICEAEDDPKYQSQIYEPQNTDIDGDGIADICARGVAGVYCALSKSGDLSKASVILELTNDAGWNDVSNYGTIRFADYNNDGLADLCARDDAGVKCWLSTGTGFGEATESIPMADADGYNDVKYYSTIRFADINGDGRDDMCARFKEGFRCYPSLGNGWDNPIELGDMADAQGWGEPKYYSTIRMADVNGDGKMDVCGRGSAGFRCWISNGDSFEKDFVAAAWSNDNGWGYPRYYETIRMADLNGDHKADICARDSGGVVCHLSQGNTMGDAFRGPELKDASGWNDYDNYSTFRFGDINGDGMDDMCVRANARFVCYLSTGEGFGDSYAIDDFSDDNGWNKPEQYRTIRLADIDKDRQVEVCGRNADGIRCFHFNGSGFEGTPVLGPQWGDGSGWNKPEYYSTLRIGGPIVKTCSLQTEICDQIDNNCNQKIDENNVCCEPSDEICDGIDNDCDGETDEDDVCCVDEICDDIDNDCDGEIDEDNVCCESSKEICDGIDNDCDGEIDEGDVCKTEEPGEVPDKDDSQTEIALVYNEDCGCSMTGRKSSTGIWGCVCLFGGMLWWRRRRDARNAGK